MNTVFRAPVWCFKSFLQIDLKFYRVPKDWCNPFSIASKVLRYVILHDARPGLFINKSSCTASQVLYHQISSLHLIYPAFQRSF